MPHVLNHQGLDNELIAREGARGLPHEASGSASMDSSAPRIVKLPNATHYCHHPGEAHRYAAPQWYDRMKVATGTTFQEMRQAIALCGREVLPCIKVW